MQLPHVRLRSQGAWRQPSSPLSHHGTFIYLSLSFPSVKGGTMTEPTIWSVQDSCLDSVRSNAHKHIVWYLAHASIKCLLLLELFYDDSYRFIVLNRWQALS